MREIGIIVSFSILIIVSSIFSGYALSVLWSWFISPTFGITNISIPVAIGIAMTISYLTYQTSECTKEDKSANNRIIEMFLMAIAKPVFALFFGWIVTLFI